jgi:starch phosphorylase
VAETLGPLAGALGVDAEEIVRLGRTTPAEEAEPFGVTQFALRASRAANGVSRRHGEVARDMWQGMWPGRPVDEVPITHVTNGVHHPTWLSRPMRELLDRHLGEGWIERAADPDTWAGVDGIPDEELWEVRNRQRSELVDWVRRKSIADRLARSEPREYVEAAAHAFSPDVLTIGFARRLATYKRLNLLAEHIDQAIDLLDGGERGVQLLLAGKAHPRDDDGKRMVQGLFASKGRPSAAARTVFLDDYDVAIGARLVAGCDIWLNLPRPPLEASGTSGMKSAVNGGLQLSVLDGWWAEAYDGANGWALPGETSDDVRAQDERDTELLHRLLGDEVVPSFYERDPENVPTAWVERMRASLRSLGPRFCAARMLEEYADGPYRRSGVEALSGHMS